MKRVLSSRTFSITIFLLLVTLVHTSLAGEHNFESTSEGILQALVSSDGIRGDNGLLRDMNKRKISTVSRLSHRPEHVHGNVLASDNSRQQKVNLNIKFDYDSFTIRPESHGLLDELAIALTDPRLSDKKILIIGHTDSDGPTLYNRNLSLKRTQSVKSYLIANHEIQPARIQVQGMGETSPLVININDINKQINRRVEIAVLE